MLSFLAFIYDAADSAQSEASRLLAHQTRSTNSEWIVGLDIPGMIVHYKRSPQHSSDCHPLTGQSGVVLGTLFATGSIGRPTLDEYRSSKIVAEGGHDLIKSYWGSYIAFLCDDDQQRKWILRSPAGHLPCYRTSNNGIHIYFSQDFADADPTPRDIDWSYIAAAMTVTRESESTGLKGVSKIQPGECVEHRRSGFSKRQYWNPAMIAQHAIFEDANSAAQELRRVTNDCVHSWASHHSSILMSLSGGLDSSIVLGCLKTAPTLPAIRCLTHYSKGYRSDERHFARLVSENAGCELIEWPRNSEIALSDMLGISRFPEPRAYFRRVEMSAVEAKFAKETNATALFNGSGGDQLFWQAHAMLAASDYVYARRFRRLLRLAYDAAQLERLSFWTVLGSALRGGLIRMPWEPLKEIRSYRTLLIEEAIKASQSGDSSIPLWLQKTTTIPPGKRRQILSLTSRSYYDALNQPGAPEPISPLMSQPVIEVCLRIPTYLSITGGWYRAIARRAFIQDVPSAILRRRSKGGMEEHLLTIWTRNLPFARDMLLDGALVQAGLIDRRKLIEALAGRPTGALKDLAELYWYLCIEVWIKRMTTSQQRRAA